MSLYEKWDHTVISNLSFDMKIHYDTIYTDKKAIS